MITLNLTVAIDPKSMTVHQISQNQIHSNNQRMFPDSDYFDPDVEDAFQAWWRGERPGVHVGIPPVVASSPPLQPLELFRSKVRTLVIAEECITLEGAEIWRNCAQTDTRDALAMLHSKVAGNFVRIRGAKLTKDLGRNPTNPIGKPFSDLRKRIVEVMRDKGIACTEEDVLTNGAGGYHFGDWMVVRVEGDWARELGIRPEQPPPPSLSASDDTADESEEFLNERQRWILDQVRAGVRLSQKDLLAHFRGKWNNSTIKRDLKCLREKGHLMTGANGYYFCDEDPV